MTSFAAQPILESRNGTAAERIRLDTISIRDFRNLERVDLTLPAEGVAIIGDNGHGKTNLLEAIYYLQILRSIRDARDQDLTRFDTAGFHIAAKAHTPDQHEIGVGFERATKRKKVMIDGSQPKRLSDALGSLASVMFSPRDLELVSGAPSERRSAHRQKVSARTPTLPVQPGAAKCGAPQRNPARSKRRRSLGVGAGVSRARLTTH